MFRRFLLLTLSALSSGLFLSPAFADEEPLFLSEEIRQSQPGDYIVTHQSRIYSLLLVRSVSPNAIVFEEITLPEGQRPTGGESWSSWLQKGAPGNTSWTAIAISPLSGRVTDAYSYSKRTRLQPDQGNSFLSTLLSLPFSPIRDADRRKVGKPGPLGRKDTRPLWQPRYVCDGEVVAGVTFTAWYANWPRDGSELSGRRLTIYMPEHSSGAPSHFPYWIELSPPIGPHRIRVVDSGHQLQSPQPPVSIG